jgi:hypothetical protein
MTDTLVNLVSELEYRLTGTSVFPRLSEGVGANVPDASTYVLILFDGLGAHQLSHPAAATLAQAERGPIESMFPTTTTVNLSTLVTGAEPKTHGVIGHHMWVPELQDVVNVLKWILPGRGKLDFDPTHFLPPGNLWERLREAGIEPITVQPGAFVRSPLSRMLYRGCRIEPVWNEREIIAATTELAATPGRLIFAYLPHVDMAAHISGQGSDDYENALGIASRVWDGVTNGLRDHAAAVGTADHGHADYSHDKKIRIPQRPNCEFYGDPRALYVRSRDSELGLRLAEDLPATWHDQSKIQSWLGEGPAHPELKQRLPNGVLMADEGYLLIPGNMDERLIGYHGGLSPDELLIPLLISQ